MINSIVISSGHGKYVRGASGIIDEVDEARRVVEMLADKLRNVGVDVKTYHDDVSTSQNENLNRIVDYHNAQMRDLDISVHFNAYEQSDAPKGTECLFTTQEELAADVSEAIASVGFINRGPKYRSDLFFLNSTAMPAILIEVCFVDSTADCDIYADKFDEIGDALVGLLPNTDTGPDEEREPPKTALFTAVGPCSHFGGPDDMGVDEDEGLAFIYDVDDAPHLFLPEEGVDEGVGLARRLNPFVHYLACRWDYNVTPKEMLLQHVALVRSKNSGFALKAFPADWGPHKDTGRVADLSPSLMENLRLETDDEVEVIFPYQE